MDREIPHTPRGTSKATKQIPDRTKVRQVSPKIDYYHSDVIITKTIRGAAYLRLNLS